MPKHIINTNAAPKFPYGDWKVKKHTKMGKLDWDKIKVELYLSEKKKDGYIKGEDLLKELEGKNPLNANVLEYLLEHQELIPEEWKGRYIFFFGTVFQSLYGDRCILFLCFDGRGWRQNGYWLGNVWSRNCPSALLASIKNMPLEILNTDSCVESCNLDGETIEIKGKKYQLKSL